MNVWKDSAFVGVRNYDSMSIDFACIHLPIFKPKLMLNVFRPLKILNVLWDRNFATSIIIDPTSTKGFLGLTSIDGGQRSDTMGDDGIISIEYTSASFEMIFALKAVQHPICCTR